MKNKEIKDNLLYLLISILVCCINIFLILPFADSNNAFSEGRGMPTKERIILILISTPMLIAYLLYILRILKKLKYFNFLNYPLNIFNISLLFTFAFLSITGYGLFFLFLILPWIGAIIYSLIGICFGLIQDTKSWIEYAKNRKQ